jgi:hypothetical protein
MLFHHHTHVVGEDPRPPDGVAATDGANNHLTGTAAAIEGLSEHLGEPQRRYLVTEHIHLAIEAGEIRPRVLGFHDMEKAGIYEPW